MLHQVTMRNPTDTYDPPEHWRWQINLAIDHYEISRNVKGILGKTSLCTVDAWGNAITNGIEAIRGTQESCECAPHSNDLNVFLCGRGLYIC